MTPKAAMPPAPRSRIGPAGILDIAGPDALTFAQAQFASNVSTLQPGHWQWSAWLDAQGRVRNVFALGLQAPGRLLAWLPLGNADTMAAALSRYVLRAKVTVRTSHEWQLSLDEAPVSVTASPDVSECEWTIPLPGTQPALVVLAREAAQPALFANHAINRLLLAAIESGLPWLPSELSGEFVAPALGLARLGATSLDKGCYPGQEIVARLHFRGGNKRHAVHLLFAADHIPAVGDAVLCGAGATRTRCGRVLFAATGDDGIGHALAILDDTRDASAALSFESGTVVQHVALPQQMAR